MTAGYEVVVELPKDINAEVSGKTIKMSLGGKTNSRTFEVPILQFEKIDSGIAIRAEGMTKREKAIMNAIASHIKNLARGLKKEFVYKLEVVFSHFPINVKVQQGFVEVNNLIGSKCPKKSKIIGKVAVEVKGKDITVKGTNKEEVAQTAANMENATRIVGKDRRVFQDGIYIVHKDKEQLELENVKA